jgi:hypothetical protein
VKKKYFPAPGYFILPADLKISAVSILTEIFEAALTFQGDEITIDASKAYWISPFTACWFAALKDELDKINRNYTVKPPMRSSANHQYKGLGIEKYFSRERIQEVPRYFSTFPVTKLNEPSYPLAGEVTSLLARQLSKVENFHKALHFAIREVIENSFEHGCVDHCYMCAYAVPSKQVVRLCILDTGIGIPASMRGNERFKTLTDDIEVVEKASEYGISSKAAERGIGLYLLRDVAQKNEADLTIISGHARVDISKEIRTSRLSVAFPGTIVKFKLRTRKDFHYLDVAGWEAL